MRFATLGILASITLFSAAHSSFARDIQPAKKCVIGDYDGAKLFKAGMFVQLKDGTYDCQTIESLDHFLTVLGQSLGKKDFKKANEIIDGFDRVNLCKRMPQRSVTISQIANYPGTAYCAIEFKVKDSSNSWTDLESIERVLNSPSQ